MDISIIPGTVVLVNLDEMIGIPAIYIKRRGPQTHMCLIGFDKLVCVKPKDIMLRASVTNEDQKRLLQAAKSYLKEGFKFVGY